MAHWSALEMVGVGIGMSLAASAFWIVSFGLAARIAAKRRNPGPDDYDPEVWVEMEPITGREARRHG